MIGRDCQKIAFNVETIKRIDEFSNFCQKIAFDIETIKCIDKFSNFVKKLHLTLKQSNALTIFEFSMQIKRFSRCFDYKCSGEVLTKMTQTNKQINMLTNRRDVRNLLLAANYVG